MKRMIEKAKEELETLETQYPNQFDYLKLELQSFISLLQSKQLIDPPSTSTATTQASATRSMKRKRVSLERRKIEIERWESEESEIEYSKKVRSQRDRVDVVLEKAQACLRKIQDVKISLSC